MRILVSALAVSSKPSGVCRHAANLVRCLLSRKEVSAVNIVVGAWAQEHFRELIRSQDSRLDFTIPTIKNTSLSRNHWYYGDFSKLAKTFNADIVHATYPVPLRKRGFFCPVVVTLHDLYPYDIPQNFGYPRVFMNQLVLRQALHGADAIACVSQNTLDRLTHRLPTLEPKSHRIYNCVERGPQGDKPPLPELDEYPFLLTVAQHRSNKNLPLTLKVFRRVLLQKADIPLKLLIVGNGGPETPHLNSLLKDLGLSNHVILLNGISDDELQWCYRQCELLLSTSLAEGFGLPIAEALLAGCQVVCSDLPVLREVSRDACSFVPLGASALNGFTQSVLAALSSRKVNPTRLPHFSIESVADAYLNLYQRLLTHPAEERSRATRRSVEAVAQDGMIQ